MNRTRLCFECLEDRLTPVTLPIGFTESVFASGLSSPTAMVVVPDGRVFVAEQAGTLRVVQNGSVLATPFLSLAVDSTGERGLLGVALDPNFASNGFVYVYYTVPSGGGSPHNRVSRFTANGNTAIAGSDVPILDLDSLSSATNHNGGAIHFGPDGKLYVAVGDNASGSNSQTLTNRLGKMLRINSDGTIPSDNPTTIDDLGTVPAGVTRSIWAAGLRNPFTFAFDSASGAMFINDVGQSSFEEIDAGRAGANYGWPTTEGDFIQSFFPNFTRPIYNYAHSAPHPFGGISIIGGAFYQPSTFSFPVSYTGDYFFADLANGWIDVRDAATGTVTNFADNPTGQIIVALAEGTSGQLLYLARSPQGAIYQITYSGSQVAIAVGAGVGGGPVAKLVDPVGGAARLSVNPFGNFTGGVRVASADVTGDMVPDLIVGAGPGGGPDVRVFDGATGLQVRQFFAFEGTFTGGVYVASGDVNADGFADIAISADLGGGPRVRVLSGKDGTVLADFLGIDDPNFRGGTRIAIGDVSGDTVPDLIVAAGFGGGPRVAIFDGTTLRPNLTPMRVKNDFFAFESTLRNGTFVAVGDVDGDGRGDVIVGAGPGGAPRVVAFGGVQDSLIASFFAGDLNNRGGVPVAARNVDADTKVEIVAGSAAGSTPGVGVYKIISGAASQVSSFLAFESSFLGGVFVG